jgi:hypothetical protein
MLTEYLMGEIAAPIHFGDILLLKYSVGNR